MEPPAASASARGPEDIVADRDKLVRIGMAAVFVACSVFGALRVGITVSTRLATPWWGNAVGAAFMPLLFLWYRKEPSRRSVGAVHATALLATIALAIPAFYGMSSSKWWLSLVGFSVLLMGRRGEGLVWSVITAVLIPTVAVLEGEYRVPNAAGEPPVERAMAGLVFVLILFVVTAAYKRAAQERARALVETAESLTRANRVKSRFLAHMSHEIRTPLHGVIAMTDLALDSTESANVQHQIKAAQDSARMLLGLLTNVLDVTRAESDALVLDPRPFRLHALLSDVLRPLAAQAAGKGLAFSARAQEGLLEGRVGDRVRVGQIVVNLVNNALKFTSFGSIDVELSAAGDGRVMLSVTDTGVGIPEGKLEHVFEPFAQAHAAEAAIAGVEGGAGLGLAIVRELVTRMDGRVRAESVPGRGATFVVEVALPGLDGATAGPTDLLLPPPNRVTKPPTRRALRAPLDVLVCEDNAVNQAVLLAMLARLGHKTTLAVDGLVALRLLESRPFDLVLTDIEMPGLSGVEVTRRLRALEGESGRRRTPVIGATAHVGEDEQHQLLDAGLDAHLGKPFTLRALGAVIDAVTLDASPSTGSHQEAL